MLEFLNPCLLLLFRIWTFKLSSICLFGNNCYHGNSREKFPKGTPHRYSNSSINDIAVIRFMCEKANTYYWFKVNFGLMQAFDEAWA
jgi:hypothetical protein